MLLLDEPLSNLDLKLRQSLRLRLRRIQRELKITTIFVTHDQGEALSLSDRIMLMKDGRMIQQGTPAEIYTHPRTTWAASFLGDANLFRGTLQTENSHGTLFTTDHGVYIRWDRISLRTSGWAAASAYSPFGPKPYGFSPSMCRLTPRNTQCRLALSRTSPIPARVRVMSCG